MPSAMAPLETMMISRPWRTRAAICRHHWPTACSSSPRPSLVTRLEPTLTTMRRASRKTEDEFMAAIKQVKGQILKPGASASGRHGANTRQETRRRESKTPARPTILVPKTQAHDRFYRDGGLNAGAVFAGRSDRIRLNTDRSSCFFGYCIARQISRASRTFFE